MYNNPNDIFGSRLIPTAVPMLNTPTLKDVEPREATKRRPEPNLFLPSVDQVPQKKVRASQQQPLPSSILDVGLQLDKKHPSIKLEIVGDEEKIKTGEKKKGEIKNERPRKKYNKQNSRKNHTCKFRIKYLKQRQKIWSLIGTVRRLREAIGKLKNEQVAHVEERQKTTKLLVCETDFPKQVFDFIKSQKRFNLSKRGGMRWTEDDMKLATSIHFQSPAAYRFLRTIFGLPCLTLIHSRLRTCFPESGICAQLLTGLKEKFACTSELQRYCVLSFDGMKIEQGLHLLKNDQISGFEEVGDGFRRNTIATELLVFMVRGLSAKWKQVNINMELMFNVLANIQFSLFVHFVVNF